MCAVASAAALLLVTSVHTASSDRPLSHISSYGQTVASRLVAMIERAVVDPIKERLPRPQQKQAIASLGPAFSGNAFVPPTILRVIVEPGGRATLSGVATPDTQVIIRSDGRALGQTKTMPSGQWHLRLHQDLAQGDHLIRSVTVTPGRDQHWPGQEVRIALPQTLTAPLVVLGQADASELVATPVAYTPDQHALETNNKGLWHTAQADVAPDGRAARDRLQVQSENDNWIAAPVFEWLRRSSVAYDQWIVDDLSGGDAGFSHVLRRRDTDFASDEAGSARTRRDDEIDDPSGRVDANRNFLGGLGERWQMLSVQVGEWMRQAQQSYRDTIVEELSDGDRVSRDRFVRATPERDLPPRAASPRVSTPRDVAEAETPREMPQVRPERDLVAPRDEVPNSDDGADWPVVAGQPADTDNVPPRVDVVPNPEQEALIRKAEEDARKARELARKAAEQAEAARKATEELLAEEKRLQSNGAARRSAAEKAAREAEFRRRVQAAEQRAAAAEAKLKDRDAEALSKEQQAQEAEARLRAAAQRKTAEDLAAAASAAADEEFATGRVQQPPIAQNQDTKIAKTDRARQSTTVEPAVEEFTVADTGRSRRLSFKDNAADAQLEEGSTFGDVDDFDPSVRYVYDMGDGVATKAKSKRLYANKRAKKRRAKSRKAKVKKRYRKKARKRRLRKRRVSKRRLSRQRGYRNRRARVRRRARLHRVSRRLYRHVRRFGRLYKFKTRRRTRYRRHAYARTIYIPRMRWRRR